MSLYHHFRPEERPFVERVLEWTQRVRDRYEIIRTDFLDPRQAFIVQALASREPGVFFMARGGFDGAERMRGVLHPEFIEPVEEDFGLAILNVTGANQFLSLEHRDYLGALLGLGIKREKFGDILVHAEHAQIIVAQEIADYVRLHMTQVHRANVLVEVISSDRLILPNQSFRSLSFTVQSPRLDAIAGDVFRISRAKILPPIHNGRVKVNWREVNDPSLRLEEGDVVSFKGFGRFKVASVGGETKKGRIRIEVSIYD
ncbi:RNA-binding protein [Aneurinibacillus sp. Ricciae_BoGa-3]|uniref:YlmH family RNA-binding protein n=1 Tax=Aneurinibacillus sp. Ricciae_BoGa-3 TaxID=3022697 RepID=UPI0023426F5A|nr:RNA-binding protein [Aneurinibacillus sp. Ricciae_BoGa-3]WCK53062.1 RNA-binding protein [Aneurinibacillus sp. Ricciae_BoGa-3]